MTASKQGIKRWEVAWGRDGGSYMKERCDGGYVTYKDHKAVVDDVRRALIDNCNHNNNSAYLCELKMENVNSGNYGHKGCNDECPLLKEQSND